VSIFWRNRNTFRSIIGGTLTVVLAAAVAGVAAMAGSPQGYAQQPAIGPLPSPAIPQYLLFEMFTYLPVSSPELAEASRVFFPNYRGPLESASLNAYAVSNANIGLQVDGLLAKLRATGDGVQRQLGIMLGPVPFDLSDDQVLSLIDNAFAVAKERGIAAGLHIDDSIFWVNRKDLWSDKNNVEWTDWNGTVVPHHRIGWVAGGAPILAPPMCYTSPAIVAEAKHRAALIGGAVKRHLDRLRAAGKAHLFAGILADWEPHLRDESPRKYGYCALHHLGYGPRNPPQDFDKALAEVMNGWIVLWAKTLWEAGIPRELIHTHIAFGGTTTAPPGIPEQFYKTADPRVAPFNDYSTAGFTVYSTKHLPDLYEILATRGNPPWGVSEGSHEDIEAGFRAASSMAAYLDGLFGHGATFVTLFQWVQGIPQSTLMGQQEIAAYRSFLQSGRP
jgi:hypothetical protein